MRYLSATILLACAACLGACAALPRHVQVTLDNGSVTIDPICPASQ